VGKVGLFFPFVNRDEARKRLWQLLASHCFPETQWKGSEKSTEFSRSTAGSFIVITGASGIGKSTMVTEGLKRLLQPDAVLIDALMKHLDSSAEDLAEEVQKMELIDRPLHAIAQEVSMYLREMFTGTCRRNLFFVTNLKENPSSPEISPELMLVSRLYYQLQIGSRSEEGYTEWIQLHSAKLQHLSFTSLLSKSVGEGLVFFVIDEAQWVIQFEVERTPIPSSESHRSTFFSRLLEVLFSAMKTLRPKIQLIPIICGTHSKAILQQFIASSYQYHQVVLPLLDKDHYLLEILNSLCPSPSPSQEFQWFTSIVTAGHPRILESFLSSASRYQYFDLLPGFYPEGYQRFLKEHQRSAQALWRVTEATYEHVIVHLPTFTHYLGEP